jgi:hypothetical protein
MGILKLFPRTDAVVLPIFFVRNGSRAIGGPMAGIVEQRRLPNGHLDAKDAQQAVSSR